MTTAMVKQELAVASFSRVYDLERVETALGDLNDGASEALRATYEKKRWPRSFGQSSEIFKWNVRGNHAADLIAGSVAKYASSGV
ncbi:MAG: hypothetical protein GAK40_01516 [Burkholderia plantarii]|nr:MAG: hypothetical protein GAK40_01516 [Burkholderia plantarii]